jgi:hypothetical protein
MSRIVRTKPEVKPEVEAANPVEPIADNESKQIEPEVAAIPNGACELFGTQDPNSKACKKCAKNYPEASAACIAKTAESKKSKKAKAPGTSAPKAARTNSTGEFSKFGHCKLNSQAGLIEVELEKPTTVDAISAATGASVARIKSHINWLVKNHSANCTKVMADGKIHFTVNA